MSGSMTIGGVLAALAEQGYALPSIDDDQISGLAAEEPEAKSPWYLRLFVGMSAWIAALLFIGFLSAANMIGNGRNDLFIGLAFCAVGILLSWIPTQKDFLRQLGLAFGLAGQVLFVWGLVEWLYSLDVHYSETTVWLTLLLIGLELLLVALNKDPIQRFLSVLIVVAALLILFVDQDLLVIIHLVAFLLAMSAIMLFRNEFSRFALSHEDLWQPLGYGMTVSLLGILVLPLTAFLGVEIEYLWVSAGLLLAALLFLEWQIMADMGLGASREPWLWILLICTLVLIIPAARVPGILGALIVLLLGFWHNKRTLLGLAALFLIFYLGAFYYNLDWSLLVKSLALMGTGILLFVTRFLFKFFTREVPS